MINKKLLVITSIIILLPMLFGIYAWDSLPDTVATHWGINNEPNGYSSKAMAVFGMPLFMIAIQWVCAFSMELDIKKKNHNDSVKQLVLWIVPLVSLLCMTMVYSFALGYELNIGFWAVLLLGVIFTVSGNYLPKCRQNWTMGIKIPWTLSDVDNWNSTHRLAGAVWVVGGLVVILMSFFTTNPIVAWSIIGVIALMILIPTVYSYLYYRKHHTEE